MSFERALCDLGVSINLMLISIFQKLELCEMKSTIFFLHMKDKSIKYLVGILKDVPIRIGRLFIHTDLVIMEMEEDSQIPIILGRPFLGTVGAIINVKHGKLTFEVGDDKIEFVMAKLMKNNSFKNSCFSLNITNQDVKENNFTKQEGENREANAYGKL